MSNFLDSKFRQLNVPQAISEHALRGMPRAVVYRGQRRQIDEVQDYWRIDDEWWRTSEISRRYFRVVLENGHILTIYQDLLTEDWYEQ